MSNWIIRDSWHDIIGYVDGQEDDGAGALILVIIGIALLAIASAVSWVWEQINNYASLDGPYRLIALYYFCMVVLPIRFGGTIFSFLNNPGLTQYTNLNLVIAISGVMGYTAVVLMIALLILRRSTARRWAALVLLLGPVTLAMIYFAGSVALHWLLSPAPS